MLYESFTMPDTEGPPHRGEASPVALRQEDRMDMRTGETYDTRETAVAAGVPDSDIAEIVRGDSSIPEVRFASGPFKNRVYKRNPSTGQLIRVRG